MGLGTNPIATSRAVLGAGHRGLELRLAQQVTAIGAVGWAIPAIFVGLADAVAAEHAVGGTGEPIFTKLGLADFVAALRAVGGATVGRLSLIGIAGPVGAVPPAVGGHVGVLAIVANPVSSRCAVEPAVDAVFTRVDVVAHPVATHVAVRSAVQDRLALLRARVADSIATLGAVTRAVLGGLARLAHIVAADDTVLGTGITILVERAMANPVAASSTILRAVGVALEVNRAIPISAFGAVVGTILGVLQGVTHQVATMAAIV
jgi:hypothetical protein